MIAEEKYKNHLVELDNLKAKFADDAHLLSARIKKLEDELAQENAEMEKAKKLLAAEKPKDFKADLDALKEERESLNNAILQLKKEV